MQQIDIKGFENYQITDDGRVWSKISGKWLKPFEDENGYYYVKLYSIDGHKWKKIHRIVAEAFIENPDNKPCVDHINTIRTDNRVFNLRWCTYKENANNSITLNKYNKRKGEKTGMFGKHHSEEVKQKLSEIFKGKPNLALAKKVYQYTMDKKLVKIWDSSQECGKNGFSQGLVSMCCNGHRKTHKGYMWSYEPL